MTSSTNTTGFAAFNRGFSTTFNEKGMTLGLVVPIESYPYGPVPTMHQHIERVQMAEQLGFKAVWLRDVLFNVPSFGDAGQVFDPFVYLGALSVASKDIALGVASLVLPQRHAAQVAKAAASVDVLSEGRLLLGVASGDRPEEYPAINRGFEDRGKRFRESIEYIRLALKGFGQIDNSFGKLDGSLDLLPRPTQKGFPMLITGGSQQTPNWGAKHLDGLITYPRSPKIQGHVIESFRSRVSEACAYNKPVMQPLYIDIEAQDDAPISPIHLGVRCGVNTLISYLKSLESCGVNHVAFNLRFNRANVEDTLAKLADTVLPHFAVPTESERVLKKRQGANA